MICRIIARYNLFVNRCGLFFHFVCRVKIGVNSWVCVKRPPAAGGLVSGG